MKTITYPQCEGCGQTIKKPSEGYTIVGAIYPACVPEDNGPIEGLGVIAGGWMEEQDGTYPTSQAWCQKCFITKLVDYLDEMVKGLPSKSPEPQQTPKE